MQRLEATAKPREQISVTANAAAILVGTGEAIWFYSWTHSERFEGQVMASQLFECHRRHRSHCIPQQPATPDVAAGPPRSGSKGTAQSEPQDASPADAAYYQLVREVVADLVDRFAKG